MTFWELPFRRRGLPVGSVPFAQVSLRPAEGMQTVLITYLSYYFERRPGQNLARFAALPDYHLVFGTLLREIAAELKATFPTLQFASYTDNSPVNERLAAIQAGLAFQGKNGLCITAQGSFVFLGEILTDGKDPGLSASFSGTCGNCRRCIDNCPTGALQKEGLLTHRCLSALTQKKGELTRQEADAIRNSGCAWGCDRCQDCCPYNRHLPESDLASHPGLHPRITGAELAGLSNREFRERYGDRAFAWRGKATLERNLRLTESE